MLIQPSGVTLNLDFLPGNSFQPERSVPLKIGFRPSGLTLTPRSDASLPAGTSQSSVCQVFPRLKPTEEAFPPASKTNRPPPKDSTRSSQLLSGVVKVARAAILPP